MKDPRGQKYKSFIPRKELRRVVMKCRFRKEAVIMLFGKPRKDKDWLRGYRALNRCLDRAGLEWHYNSFCTPLRTSPEPKSVFYVYREMVRAAQKDWIYA